MAYKRTFKRDSWDYDDLVDDLVDRIDYRDWKRDEYDAVYQAMDEGLIYTDDQWTMLKEHCTPQDIDFNYAWEQTQNDVMDKAREKFEDEEDDEETYDSVRQGGVKRL